MGSQGESSLDASHLGPNWFLTTILFTSSLLLPAVSLDSLTCYYCPLQQKGKSCPNITSQCLPHQRCSSSRGHYGPIYVLSAQGCIDLDLCSSHEIVSYRGVEYNVSHTCCCKDKCNNRPESDLNLKMLLRIITHKKDLFKADVLREEPWDSCANYTTATGSTLPAIAS
ncbi:protein Bouncer-like isoform X1 [Cheilinus undulatus]|uniref:protein Bouncer-like isoform X1 n=1 Tax=Cheilinus undulatus TaxID=241271 RepID=UPI001BD2FF91|nr:protein Bouncer-like isoform X1 [Cheilinus undulatus]